MKRNHLSRLMAAVGLVLVMVTMVLPARAQGPGGGGPGCEGYPRCTEAGTICTCSLEGGTISISCGGVCESEGGEEEGKQHCTTGLALNIYTCENGEIWLTWYKCIDGEWIFQDKQLTASGVDCNEVQDQFCLLDGPRIECQDLPDNETPCEDLDWSTAGIQCLGEYGLNVSVTVPCQRVGRIPYPRGMVVVPNRMWITADSPAWVESWSQTLDYNACLNKDIKEGDRLVRNFRIGLAWGRINSMPPYWEVEDSGVYRGWVARGIVWERSSWGKPECGPGLHGERLPAYRVRVYTYWQAYWRRVYERQKKTTECVWRQDAHDDGRCECIPPGEEGSCDDDTNGDGVSDWAGWVTEEVLCDTDADGDGIPDDECWETVDSGWQPFDLRAFGYPTSYFVSSAAGPVPTTLEPNPGCSGVCVPVIEVQGVIRNPRAR